MTTLSNTKLVLKTHCTQLCRKSAESVTNVTSSLTDIEVTVDRHWHGALAALMELNQALPEPLRPQKAPLDYLSTARGFREAYGQSGCSVPRLLKHFKVFATDY